MGYRTALSIAASIVATSSPQLLQSGPKREALEQLKDLVGILPDERPDDFHERMDNALASRPTEREPALAWFVNKALELSSDREIWLSPFHQESFVK
jgi:hypothetical protein